MTASRVLCYAPYNRWALHGQWEMTILHGLRNRGADVKYVLCDGLYTDCDVFWQATEPRPANACGQCQAEVTGLVHRLGMEYAWLGRYLDPEQPRTARRWVESLSRRELMTARFGEWDVASWVASSVHSHFRVSSLDLASPAVEASFRSYLYSGLVAAFALDRLYDDYRPDVLLLFNGRQSSTRVALEIARAKDIRVIVHERGMRTESLSLLENTSCVGLEPIQAVWRDWGEVPLAHHEIEAVAGHLLEREHGVGASWTAFSEPPQCVDAVRGDLGLEPCRPTWVLFTSSDDELVSEADWGGDFVDQLEWIERTVAYAGTHPELDLVIRVHPNTGSKRSTGANRRQLEEFEALERTLPANVKLVASDAEISSYTLMEIATAGLVYHSTVGLELACKGKAVVVAAGCPVLGTPFVRTVLDAGAYATMLDELRAIPAGAYSVDVARLAHRFAFGWFFRASVDFPLVHMPRPSQGVPRWSAPSELVPGLDAGLDRCARILLDGEAVCPPPGVADLARTDDAELAWFTPAAPAARFTALAFAEELIADVSLLRAWARTFSAADDATLVIRTPSEAMDRLVETVGLAGLDAPGSPDLLAVTGDTGAFDALYSRLELAHVDAPRFDDASSDALRDFALARLEG